MSTCRLVIFVVLFMFSSLVFAASSSIPMPEGSGKQRLFLSEQTVQFINRAAGQIRTIEGDNIELADLVRLVSRLLNNDRSSVCISEELLKVILEAEQTLPPERSLSDIVDSAEKLLVDKALQIQLEEGNKLQPQEMRADFIHRLIIPFESSRLTIERIAVEIAGEILPPAAQAQDQGVMPLRVQVNKILAAEREIGGTDIEKIVAHVNRNSSFSPVSKDQVVTIIYAQNLIQGFISTPTVEDIMTHTEIRMVQDARISFILENQDVIPEALRHYFIENKQIPENDTALELKCIDSILGRSFLLNPGQQVLAVLAIRVALMKTGFNSFDQRAWAYAIREALQGQRFRFVFSSENDLSVEKIKNILDIRLTLEQEGTENDIVQNIIDRLLIAEESAKDKPLTPRTRGGSGHGVEFTMQGIVVNGDGTIAMPMPTVGEVLRSKICRAGQRALRAIGIRRSEPAAVEDPWKGREKERAFLREHIVGRGIRR